MTKLILSGKRTYLNKMSKHLKKEHPSTRHRLRLEDNIMRDKIGKQTYDNDNFRCGVCNKKVPIKNGMMIRWEKDVNIMVCKTHRKEGY